MAEAFHVNCFWRARREPIDDCVRRVDRLFAELRRIDASFTRWFRKGRSRKDALRREVALDADVIRSLLLRGRNRTDTSPRAVIEDLGFSLSLWNGASDEESVAISIFCGSYNARVNNSCVIDLPRAGAAAKRVLAIQPLVAILSALAEAFEPDSGTVSSSSLFDARPGDCADRSPRIGWLTYYSRREGREVSVPAPSSVVAVGDLGWIVVADPSLDFARPLESLEAIDAVTRAFDTAGIGGMPAP